MRNEPRYSVLLIVGLVFLLASSVISCGQTETWTTYHNPKYGYTIDYPRDWYLDTSEAPEKVFIGCPSGDISISVYDTRLPIEDRTRLFLAVLSLQEDNKVISNHSLDDKWEWVIEYTYRFEGEQGSGKAYFGETSDYQFVLCSFGEEGWVECEEVMETFVAP